MKKLLKHIDDLVVGLVGKNEEKDGRYEGEP
jgi:hypothetical protein